MKSWQIAAVIKSYVNKMELTHLNDPKGTIKAESRHLSDK